MVIDHNQDSYLAQPNYKLISEIIEKLEKDNTKLKREIVGLKRENVELKSENHNLKEQLENFIPRRRVRRVFKQLKKILEQDGKTDDLDIED